MEARIAKAREKAKGRPSSRSAILDAATGLVHEIGAKHLTLDAVAARAGVSKGGLLYHFPSKEDLLTAMVQLHMDELMAQPEIFGQLRSERPGLGLKALVACRSAENEDFKRETASSLIAAAAERPGLLEPVRKFHREVWATIASNTGDPKVLSALMLGWFALEGEFLLGLLDISPVTEDLRQQLIATAMALLDGALAITDIPPGE